jgi:8-oxo-dGTP diphosphatase
MGSLPEALGNENHVIEVAAAVIRNPDGRLLLTRRAEHAMQGGLWEFPGGKVQRGESLIQALSRELLEELGIAATNFEPLISVRHAYPEFTVRLNVFHITAWQGNPQALEGQPLGWFQEGELERLPMPDADRPVIGALRLPSTYPITPGGPVDADWWRTFEHGLDCGYRMVQLRVKEVAGSQLRAIAERAAGLANRSNCKIILNGPTGWVDKLGLAGAHLTAAELMSLRQRPLAKRFLLGASCHSLEELRQAEKIGADWACLSPVNRTGSHPESAPLGMETFSSWVREVSLPVYGLGGLSQADIPAIRAAGGQGVAGLSGFWVS